MEPLQLSPLNINAIVLHLLCATLNNTHSCPRVDLGRKQRKEGILYNTKFLQALYFGANLQIQEIHENLVLANFEHFHELSIGTVPCLSNKGSF